MNALLSVAAHGCLSTEAIVHLRIYREAEGKSMCICDPTSRRPYCGKPGCEMPQQKPQPWPPITVRKVIELLLEMDDQFVSGRPSHLLHAANLVQHLANHAEGSLRQGIIGDGYEKINTATDRRRNDRTGW